MLATSHALVGAAIATKISNPLIGLPIIFLLHIPLDAVPHWDLWTNGATKSRKELFIRGVGEVVLSFALTWPLFSAKLDPVYLFLIIISSQALDWLEIPYRVFGLTRAPFSWPYQIQHIFHSKYRFPNGLITQVVFVVVTLWMFGIFTL